MSSKPTSPKPPVASRIPVQKAHIPHSVFDALPDSAFIRESQLVQSPKRPGIAALLPFSAPTLWRKVKAGTFPKPAKLSERVTAFNVGAVRSWMAAQAMVEGLVVTNNTPQEKAAARSPKSASQPHGYSAPAHADDATSLKGIPKKKQRHKALTTPAAPAALAIDRLVHTDAQDAPASALSVAEPRRPQQHRQTTT
jgi:prophage regulatory protein